MRITNNAPVGNAFYLPHHPVFKFNSSTKKLKIVFDGSAKTKTGLSLNDTLLKGPKVQPDIFHILLRFRIHQIAVSADVEQIGKCWSLLRIKIFKEYYIVKGIQINCRNISYVL